MRVSYNPGIFGNSVEGQQVTGQGWRQLLEKGILATETGAPFLMLRFLFLGFLGLKGHK